MDQAAKDASGEPEAAVGVEEAIRMVRNAREEVDATILRHNSPSQSVNVGDKQSAAIWILVAASMLVLGLNMGQRDTITQQAAQISQQSAQITEIQRKYDRMQDYLNAIYAQAPHLRPKETKSNP